MNCAILGISFEKLNLAAFAENRLSSSPASSSLALHRVTPSHATVYVCSMASLIFRSIIRRNDCSWASQAHLKKSLCCLSASVLG